MFTAGNTIIASVDFIAALKEQVLPRSSRVDRLQLVSRGGHVRPLQNLYPDATKLNLAILSGEVIAANSARSFKSHFGSFRKFLRGKKSRSK